MQSDWGLEEKWGRPRSGALLEVLRRSGTLIYNQPPMLPIQDPAGPSERINFRYQDTHMPSIVRKGTRANKPHTPESTPSMCPQELSRGILK